MRNLSWVLEGFDVVHCFSYYSNIYDFVAPLCRLLGIPLVAQAQGIYPTIGRGVWLRKIFTLRMADKLLPLNSSEAKFLVRKFGIEESRVEVIPNFVDPSDYVFLSREEARSLLGIGSDEFVVLTVCRLVPQKGVQTLLRAAARLGDLRGLRVVVVGEGPYRRELEELARRLGLGNVVRFEGWVHGGRIGMYYSAADCFVLASFEESFGIVLLEAMLYGLPVIASRTWGALEVIGDSGAGALFPPGDEASLSRLIERLYENKEEAAAMREIGRRLVLERFSPEEVFKRLERVYGEVLG